MQVLSKLFLAVLCFCLFTTASVNASSPLLGSLDFYAVIVLVFVSCRQLIKTGVASYFAATLCLLVGLVLYLCAVVALAGTNDSSGFRLFGKLVPLVFASHGLALLFVRRFHVEAPQKFFEAAFLVASIQGVVLILSFLDPSVRAFLDQVFVRDYSFGVHLVEQRVPGFVATGGDGLSLNQALLACVAAGATFYRRGVVVVAQSLFLAMMVVATIVTGRSGLYLGMATLFVVMLSRRGSFNWGVAAAVCGVLAVFVVFGKDLFELARENAYLLAAEQGFNHPIVRALSVFREYDRTGSWLTSVPFLGSGMWLFPEDDFRAWFGNGEFGRLPGAHLASDIGYVRMLFGLGILGSVLAMASIVVPVASCVRRLRHGSATLSYRSQLSYLIVLVVVFGCVGHFKILYLFSRVYFVTLMSLSFLILELVRQGGGERVHTPPRVERRPMWASRA